MDALAYESIAQFCINQYGKFDENAWLRRGAADGKLVAVAAKYLSMTSWFGNEDALERIAAQIHDGMSSSTEFNRELRSIGLDLARFSATVRCGIATNKPPRPPLRARPELAVVAA